MFIKNSEFYYEFFYETSKKCHDQICGHNEISMILKYYDTQIRVRTKQTNLKIGSDWIKLHSHA